MNLIKKIYLNLKYKNIKFKYLGKEVDYMQIHSKFLYSENISINNYSKILDYAFFDGIGGIEIGECTIIAPYCTIITSNHNYDETKINLLPFDNTLIMKKVSIGNYCWIGRNVMIMPGVKIGDGTVIAAGSIVTKSFEGFSVIGGNPAKIIKKRNKEKIIELISQKKCWNNKKINKNNKKIYIRNSNNE